MPTHSELLLTELKARYAEMRRQYPCVLVAADWNMRLALAAHAPPRARVPSGSDAASKARRAAVRRQHAALFPRRATEDAQPASLTAARTRDFSRLCRSMGVTVAHGSFPHQAPAFATSGPVGALAGGRFGTAEVDAFVAPWECLRDGTTAGADGETPPAMHVLALPLRMRWPGDRGAQSQPDRALGASDAADARSDDVGHPTDDEGDSTQASYPDSHTSSDDMPAARRRGSGTDASASSSSGSSSESDEEDLSGCDLALAQGRNSRTVTQLRFGTDEDV